MIQLLFSLIWFCNQIKEFHITLPPPTEVSVKVANPSTGKTKNKGGGIKNNTKTTLLRKVGYDEWKQIRIDYAMEKWGDKRFVYMITGEGDFDENKLSIGSYWCPKKGRMARDHGICQISDCWEGEKIVNDERFKDWRWQIEKCKELYDGGVTFYGVNKIGTNKNKYIEIPLTSTGTTINTSNNGY
jgi:hypothetical protein